jgi:bleomycin hydrolase
MKGLKSSLFVLVLLLFWSSLFAQEKEAKKEEESGYRFTIVVEVPHTSVKNQARTATCWCFATISFLESEFLRSHPNSDIDLSEMFVVRHTYPHKARSYVRLHGNATFGQGGQSHDVIDQIRRYGIVPEEVYTGMRIDEKHHNHGEMFAVLRAMLDAVIQKRGSRLTPRWLEAFEAVLDVYLGRPPETFTYQGKTYTPKQFRDEYLKLNMDDYIEITSYNSYPFYSFCRLEVPDNWSFNDNYFNVPIDDMERIADNALKHGYSIVWDGDTSDRNFSTKKGYAIVPVEKEDNKSEKEKETASKEPVPEKEITQEMRQLTFDNYETTDDHLMHIVGLAQDQNGTKFYYTKNSYGPKRKYGGYIYLSRSYFRLRTIAIMVHKDALPKDIKKKYLEALKAK